MVDWFLAEKIATYVAGTPDDRRPRADLAALVADSQQRVVDYTQLPPQRPLPPPEGIERPEWVKANLSGMKTLLDPVLAKAGGSGPLRPALRIGAGAVMTLEVGVILGFMAQRVLGQYELVLLEPTADSRPPRLLFVMPNLGGAVRSFGVDEQEFVHWVALHEVTHSVQFAGVPWLQSHLAALVSELLSHMELRVDAARAFSLPDRAGLRRAVDAVRAGDIVSLVAKPQERELIDRLQATMAVVEGHAEHVMDAVGKDILPSLDELRSALESRRANQSTPARLLAKLLGLELKLRQYKQGKAFCDAVVADGGIERLNVVWSAPDALPTADELEHPSRWLERTAVIPV